MKKLLQVVLLLLFLSTSSYAMDTSGHDVLEIDRNLSSKQVTLKKKGKSVFFYNNTKNDIINLEIHFGKKVAFCASGTMRIDEQGVYRSIKPIFPGAFVTACFPEEGEYQVKVHGLNNQTQTTSIKVSNENT